MRSDRRIEDYALIGDCGSPAPCGFRARLHQLGEALIPRGTKSSNPSPSSEESVANSRSELRPFMGADNGVDAVDGS